jgi:hypothetical protein
MNKKGYYAILLWAVVTIGVLLLYSSLTSRIARTGAVGDVELPLLRIQAERTFLNNYITQAAMLSMPTTIKTTEGSCTYANIKDRPKILTMQMNATDTAKQAFNTKMNEYLTAYAMKTKQDIPPDNYELYFTQGEIEGIAIQPAILQLNDFTGKTIGTWAYRPNFKIKYDHKLEEYPQIKTILEIMAKECSDTDKPEDCVAKRIPTSWSFTMKDDEYTFIANLGKTRPCYILHLPAKTTTPTI